MIHPNCPDCNTANIPKDRTSYPWETSDYTLLIRKYKFICEKCDQEYHSTDSERVYGPNGRIFA